MATRIAAAVALGQDRQALAARAELFRDIDAFGRDVAGSLAIEPLAEMIIEATARVVAADSAGRDAARSGDGRYMVRAGRGAAGRVVGREIPSARGSPVAPFAIEPPSSRRASAPDEFPASIQDLRPPDADARRRPAARPRRRRGRGADHRPHHGRRLASAISRSEGLQLLASSAALAVANAFLHAEVAELGRPRSADRPLQPAPLRRGARPDAGRAPPRTARTDGGR